MLVLYFTSVTECSLLKVDACLNNEVSVSEKLLQHYLSVFIDLIQVNLKLLSVTFRAFCI